MHVTYNSKYFVLNTKKKIQLDIITIKIYRLENWTLEIQVTCSQTTELKWWN